MKINSLLVWCISVFLVAIACNRNAKPENIPTGPVNLTIDLNLPSNLHLVNVGTYGYFTGGIKGVLVVHDFDDQWYAFERTCAWQPLNACSVVWADSINLQFKCGTYSGTKFSSCCESLFTYSGFPSKGPANGRLAQYKIQKISNIVSVFN